MSRSSFRCYAVPVTYTLVLLIGCRAGSGGDVVATVNGRPIQRAELDRAYRDAIESSDPQQKGLSREQADELRLQLLDTLIWKNLLEQQAAKIGVSASDDEVDAKLIELESPYTVEQFQARLKLNHQTADDLRRDLRFSITEDKLLNKEINSKITVTDADVNAYYLAHKAEFDVTETQYHLAEIVVAAGEISPRSTPGATSLPDFEADAKKRIRRVKNRLDSGEDFGMVAMSSSESPQTQTTATDIGVVSESQLRSNIALYTAVSKLRNGQDTDIIAMPEPSDPSRTAGYAIFRLLDKVGVGQRDVNDPAVQQAVRQQVRESRSTLLEAAYFRKLRNSAKVTDFLVDQIVNTTAR